MEKYTIEPIIGNVTTMESYPHIVKMAWYDPPRFADISIPADNLLSFGLQCKGIMAFIIAMEEDADYDSPTLVSFRMGFSDPSDAILFKLSMTAYENTQSNN